MSADVIKSKVSNICEDKENCEKQKFGRQTAIRITGSFIIIYGKQALL